MATYQIRQTSNDYGRYVVERIKAGVSETVSSHDSRQDAVDAHPERAWRFPPFIRNRRWDIVAEATARRVPREGNAVLTPVVYWYGVAGSFNEPALYRENPVTKAVTWSSYTSQTHYIPEPFNHRFTKRKWCCPRCGEHVHVVGNYVDPHECPESNN
jgi:hypothetical protein